MTKEQLQLIEDLVRESIKMHEYLPRAHIKPSRVMEKLHFNKLQRIRQKLLLTFSPIDE